MQKEPGLKSRIEIVDALRGFALFGIIIAHFNNQYFASMPPQGHTMGVQNNVDGVLEQISQIFFHGKFYTIFSFLFGLSFGLQLLKAKEKGKALLGRFSWRLILLLMIGLIHQYFFRGDIFTIYVALGFILLLFIKAGDKWLLIWSFVFLLNVPSVLVNIGNFVAAKMQKPTATTEQAAPPAGFDMDKMQKDAKEYFDNIKNGAVIKIGRSNMTAGMADKLFFQLFSGRLFVTLGLFLLGYYMARKKVFENLQNYKQQIKKWLFIGLGIAILTVIIVLVTQPNLFGGTNSNILQLVGAIFYNFFDPALTMVYTGSFLLVFIKKGNASWLNQLAPMGRMGLTTYLMQTLFGLLIFFGYGLNKMDVWGNSIVLPIAIAIYIAQIFFSIWWMKHFYYGPVEWLWRAATWFILPPFKKKV